MKAMLMILDGWGIGKDYRGNAISNAKTPVFDRLMNDYPHTTLEASGLAVGLPEGQMGNSEVGHMNIGAGRIIYQELTRINKEIEEGQFFKNPTLLQAIEKAKENGTNLHLIGLVSHGGVHSHMNHLFALLDLCRQQEFSDVYIHAILDGRDVSPNAGYQDLQELQEKLDTVGIGKILTVSGRYYAMDRDKRWERVEKAYNAMVMGQGEPVMDICEAVKKSYEEDITDEFVLPKTVVENGEPVQTINDNDSIIFFNFRPDRARQLTRALVDDEFDGFVREKRVHTNYYTLTMYDKTIENVQVCYPPETYVNTMGQVIADNGKKQLRIAETEKYAHVTFFYNGGREQTFEHEDRILVPSPKVATYDLKPEMSAFEVKDRVVEQIKSDQYDMIILNFANTDMVGHTGVLPAAIKAVETVDGCIGDILKAIDENGDYTLFITADHGNSEKLIDEDNNNMPFTAHTTNLVPFIEYPSRTMTLKPGRLCDISPTMLDVMGLEQPKEMTGSSLIIKED